MAMSCLQQPVSAKQSAARMQHEETSGPLDDRIRLPVVSAQFSATSACGRHKRKFYGALVDLPFLVQWATSVVDVTHGASIFANSELRKG